ncbi:hypothetical protein MKY84_13090 [Chryseomicrobium sp. FSL W7-1435]|uniref:hypothetical protein n=1 Tax=Chryseomicrobium sp. FSL W7-1435 TaxID=2921704 RepID=UPI00315A4864
MPLEQEFLPVAQAFIYGISVLFAIWLAVRWKQKRVTSKAAFAFLLYLISSVTAFFFLFEALGGKPPAPMASEENSLQLAFAGVFWLIGVAGVFALVLFTSSKTVTSSAK